MHTVRQTALKTNAMDTARFIAAFKSLHSSHQRQDALQALLDELNPYDWRTLHALTGARTFHTDIIGQLPLELVAHIFTYLDTSTPYRLQHVSRRWCHQLRNLYLLKHSLNQWYQGTLDLGRADYAFCEHRARCIHAFRYGKPRSCFKIVPQDHFISYPILIGDLLIYLRREPMGMARQVHIIDLKSWSLRTLCAQGREAIKAVFASDELIVIPTLTNYCYVSKLSGEGQKRFSAPNSELFDSMTCRGRTVAGAVAQPTMIAIYIWDYDTQRGTTLFLQNRTPQRLQTEPRCGCAQQIALLLQPSTKTIVTFSTPRCQRPSCPKFCDYSVACAPMTYSRFTYSGDCISSTTTQLPIDYIFVDFEYGKRMRLVGYNPISIDEKGRYMVQTVELPGGGRIYRQFDENLNELDVEIDSPPHEVWGWSYGHIYARWKDITYELRPNEKWHHESKLKVHDLVAHSKSWTHTSKPIISSSMGENKEEAVRTILLNEDYVVCNMQDRIYLHCFDDSGRSSKQHGSLPGLGEFEVLDKLEREYGLV